MKYNPMEGSVGAISNKKLLVDWVAGFLCYWEDSDMLSTDAAEIIVSEISKAIIFPEGSRQNDLYPLPGPESFFPDQEE
jgi:hypothetical protein